MQVPKRRTSRSKRNKRRSHDALRALNPGVCRSCGEPVMPHRVCHHCGAYRGRQLAEPRQ